MKEKQGNKTSRGALYARLGDAVKLTSENMMGKGGLPEPDGDPLAEFRSADQMTDRRLSVGLSVWQCCLSVLISVAVLSVCESAVGYLIVGLLGCGV
jgi:hypothetical protein